MEDLKEMLIKKLERSRASQLLAITDSTKNIYFFEEGQIFAYCEIWNYFNFKKEDLPKKLQFIGFLNEGK